MSCNPTLSVVICVYNPGEFFPELILNLLSQTYRDFETLIIDDGSTRGQEYFKKARKLIKTYRTPEGKKSPVDFNFYRNNRNLGLFESRRVGARISRGSYITFVDADDKFKDGFSLEKIMKEHEKAGFPHVLQFGMEYLFPKDFTPENIKTFTERNPILPLSRACSFKERGNQEPEEPTPSPLPSVTEECFVLKHIPYYVCGKIYSASILEESLPALPFTRLTMLEDFLFNFFVLQYAKSLHIIEEEFYLYRIGSGVTSLKREFQEESFYRLMEASGVFTMIFEFLEREGQDEGLLETPMDSHLKEKLKKAVWERLLRHLYSILEYTELAGEKKDFYKNLVTREWGEKNIKTAQNMFTD